MSPTTRTAPLSEVAAINPPLEARLAAESRVSFVPMAAVSAELSRTILVEERRYAEVAKGYTPFAKGDVLLAKITPCFENGKIAQADIPHLRGFGSTEFHVLRPHPDRLDARYLLHFLRQDTVRRVGERRMTGSAGQRRVPESFLRDLDIPIPVMAEQRRIANVLDHAEGVRAQRQATIERLDALASAIFFDLFGDPVVNPKRWPVRQLGQIGHVITGNTPPRAHPEYFGSDIEWIKSDNINTVDYYLTRAAEGLSAAGRTVARIAPPGSILVTCIAGSPGCIGNAGLSNREVAFNQQINALVPSEGDPDFIYALIRHGKRLIQRASTEGMKGMVSKSRFQKVEVPYPPVSLQKKFGQRAMALQTLRARYVSSLSECDALFASIQHRAFSGAL